MKKKKQNDGFASTSIKQRKKKRSSKREYKTLLRAREKKAADT